MLLFVDEPACAFGLREVLSQGGATRVPAVCTTHSDLLAAALQHQPHAIIYSSNLDPDLALLTSLRNACPTAAVILWARDFSAEMARHAMDIGIRGFLSTTASAESIRECLQLAVNGELWMERSLSNLLLNTRPVKLSRRQSQLLALLTQGLKNREIANAMSISEGTVKAYLTTLFEKVGARDRFELALFGMKHLRGADTDPDHLPRLPVRAPARMSRFVA